MVWLLCGAHVKPATRITTMFLDIGGVVLTDGWDHHARRRAATHFELEWSEMEARHRATFETHEQGKLTFDEYLALVVFHQPRSFTRTQFRRFMFAQSKPHPKMIELVTKVKAAHGLRIAVVSNEARELNAFRIRRFKLGNFVDFFVSSCFIEMRKPDADVFRLALDLAQVEARNVVYIDNTAMFAQVANQLGIHSIVHTSYRSTRAQLATLHLGDVERKGRSHERH